MVAFRGNKLSRKRIYICIPVHGRFKGFDWGITTRLVVIPHAVVTFDLVVIPQ